MNLTCPLASATTSRYNLKSVCRAAMVFRIASTAKLWVSQNDLGRTSFQQLTFPQRCLVLRNMSVGSDRLVLAINKHPQPDVRLGEIQGLSNNRLECGISVGFEHAERSKVRGWCVLVLKSRQVEALVVAEGFVRDDLGCKSGIPSWTKRMY